jgi:hypothetical protein
VTVENFILLLLFLLGIWLLFQPWLWALLFFIGALASFFAMVASVIHFQILGAVGCFFLTGICWAIFTTIIDRR